MSLPKSVFIRELGPREGFQTLSKIVPTKDKLALIEALSATGVKEIELASFVRPDRVPQMADAEEIVKNFTRKAGVRYTALYLNEKGFERAEASARLDNQGWIYLAASETFLKKNNNLTIAESLATIPGWIKTFRAAKKPLHGLMISTAFGCTYEGAIPSSKVLGLTREAMTILKTEGAEPKELSLADTMGWATPQMLQKLVAEVRALYPSIQVSLHLHDTRGTGIANVYAGLLEGVSVIDASIGGMGGCPFAKGAAGNVATEEVVYLCESLGVQTGIELNAACRAADLAEKITGQLLPSKYLKAWRSAQS